MRKDKGNSIVELPMILFLVFVVVSFPLIGLASMSYRSALFSAAINRAGALASRARSFSEARTIAQTELQSGCAGFTGIEVNSFAVSIVTKDRQTAAETERLSSLPKGSVDTEKNLYFIRVKGQGSIQPMVCAGGFFGQCVPGLNSPYNLNGAVELFAERPRGLAF